MDGRLPRAGRAHRERAEAELGALCSKGLVPRDRKPYLADLRRSRGPLLAAEGPAGGRPGFLLDASSQIATLGLGFNPACLFGASQSLDAWVNDPRGGDFLEKERAFRALLARKAGGDVHVSWCASGAEAVETALGFCLADGPDPGARTALAFEGSFHGRMKVALSATWNPAKRGPFEWPGFETAFCPWPALDGGPLDRPVPDGWLASWARARSLDFRPDPSWARGGADLAREAESLLAVRDRLLRGGVFAVLAEPMQCEGGDRYASGRFHSALLLLARAFGVPVVHDEIQTGFGLGGEFFWHRALALSDAEGRALRPDHVVFAKKAQVGGVLSLAPPPWATAPPCVASLMRGYAQGASMDQRRDAVAALGREARSLLDGLVGRHPDVLSNPRARGLAFAFDVPDAAAAARFMERRFEHGLIYYPAGERTLRFRLNASLSGDALRFLFEGLDRICRAVFRGGDDPPPESLPAGRGDPEVLYRWASFLRGAKLRALGGGAPPSPEEIGALFQETTGRRAVLADEAAVAAHGEGIMALQERVYEPARISPLERYRAVAAGAGGTGLLVLEDGRVVAMSFASPLADHPLEPGVARDPFFGDRGALYCIDTTVDPGARGGMLGLSLKCALAAHALAGGAVRLQGRNRHRLAGAMLDVNLFLGACEQEYVREDYADSEPHRDTIYYTTRVRWEREATDLGGALESPLGSGALDPAHMEEQAPSMVNKICLSNFASSRFLSLVEEAMGLAPERLRHGYVASGESECADKAAKALWAASDKGPVRMVSFEGHSFGTGSFLSRSLGGVGGPPFFPVDRLPAPTEEGADGLLRRVGEVLDEGPRLGVWIEPLPRATMVETPRPFLAGLRALCSERRVPLVYNETASQFYRYDGKRFLAAQDPDLAPDALVLHAGGQAGLVCMAEPLFLEKPLMMISTWDGDEFSLGNYVKAVRDVERDPGAYLATCRAFERRLGERLGRLAGVESRLRGSRGAVRGALPPEEASWFRGGGAFHTVCASRDQMRRFLGGAT